MRQSFKPLWIDGGFGQLKENIRAAKEEIDEEIQLASEKRIQRIPQLQMEPKNANAQTQRLEQLQETKENTLFGSQQTFALANTKELRIQKIINEEGTLELSIIASQV